MQHHPTEAGSSSETAVADAEADAGDLVVEDTQPSTRTAVSKAASAPSAAGNTTQGTAKLRNSTAGDADKKDISTNQRTVPPISRDTVAPLVEEEKTEAEADTESVVTVAATAVVEMYIIMSLIIMLTMLRVHIMVDMMTKVTCNFFFFVFNNFY